MDEGLHLIGKEGPRAFRAESKAVVTVSSVPFQLGDLRLAYDGLQVFCNEMR